MKKFIEFIIEIISLIIGVAFLVVLTITVLFLIGGLIYTVSNEVKM